MTHPDLLSTPIRELNFDGKEKALSIKLGFAIVSLRNPRSDYEFTAGERILANCRDDGEKVPVVVIDSLQQPLGYYSIPLLALDGFFDHDRAIQTMRTYRGYEKTTVGTVLKAIAIVHQPAFEALPDELQQQAIGTSLKDLVYLPQFRHIFFPTMAFWLSNYRGANRYRGTPEHWRDFLEEHRLISKDQLKQMSEFMEELDRDDNVNAEFAFHLRRNPEYLQKIALDPTSPYFRPLILGLFERDSARNS